MPMIDTERTPAEWLTQRLPRRFDAYGSAPDSGAWYRVHDLLDDDAQLLAAWHGRVVATEHATSAAAATYLAGWIGGGLAGAVGHALATVDAGLVVGDGVRFHQHPAGWIDRIDLGHPEVLVPDGHPWHGLPSTTTVDPNELRERAVDALVTVLTPIIRACHDLGRTGFVGLWNEVADGLGLAVAHIAQAVGIPPRPDVVDTLAAAVRTPRSPWRAVPRLRIVDTGDGRAYVGQKGGCCLAYTCGDHPDTEIDDDHRAFLERFPRHPDEPRYCTTCKFRDPVDSEQRQRFWLERTRAG